MKNVALIYATRMGQTAKIADVLKAELERRGCAVSVWNIQKSKPQIDSSIDTVIYGSPVYAGGFSGALLRWLRHHHADLRHKRLALFTVSLNHADQHAGARFDDDRLLRNFISRSMIAPDFVASFSGRLAYTRYPRLIRWKMRQIAARAGGSVDTTRDHEYTEWNDVSRFVDALSNDQMDSKFKTARQLKNQALADRFMPEFEHTLEATCDLPGFSQDEVFNALKSLMGTVKFLSVTPMADSFPHEMASTSVGRFAGLQFHPLAQERTAFAEFNSPGFIKVLLDARTDLVFEDDIRVTVALRIHSTDSTQRSRLNLRWPFIRLAFQLYQRRLFGLIRKACLNSVLVSGSHSNQIGPL